MKLSFPNLINLSKKTLNKVTFYDDCEKMPLYNFYKYIETQDLRWFTSEFVESDELPLVIEKFYNDYIALSKNQSIQNRFSTMFEIMRLENKYRSVYSICTAICNYDVRLGNELLYQLTDLLGKWHYKISKEKELFSQIDAILNRIKGIKTRIEVLTDKLKTEDKHEVQSVRSQLLDLERALDLKYRLDPKEMSVKEYIELQNKAQKEVSERNKKAK